MRLALALLGGLLCWADREALSLKISQQLSAKMISDSDLGTAALLDVSVGHSLKDFRCPCHAVRRCDERLGNIKYETRCAVVPRNLRLGRTLDVTGRDSSVT